MHLEKSASPEFGDRSPSRQTLVSVSRLVPAPLQLPRMARLSILELRMSIVHSHNLARPLPDQRPYGIRVRLKSSDPFRNLVGNDWTHEHWFGTREERDRALQEMSGRYIYFRPGDQPTLEYEVVDKK